MKALTSGLLLLLMAETTLAADLSSVDTTPAVNFTDTSVTDGVDWEISATEEGFVIFDVNQNHSVFSAPHDDPDVADSIVISVNGDIRWGGGAMLFNKLHSSLGIGGFSSDDNLHISDDDGSTSIRLEDASEICCANAMFLRYADDFFSIRGAGSDIVKIAEAGSNSNALFIDSAGRIGHGTDLPNASLEVTRDDGSTQVLVNETNPTEATRELLKLSNAGNTKFIIANTQAVDPSEWGFTNNGNDFRISYQGSGVVEMQVFQGGNVTIDGTLTENSDRSAKTDIRDLDQQAVLDKVLTLDIDRWQYKDTPNVDHIGPMAQDFHAAFGLGNTDTGISTLDTSGVALVSIQALAKENQQLHAQNLSLEQRLRTLEEMMSGLVADQSDQLANH